MRHGDLLFFDQFTYHRLPNVSQNTMRWSVDFRFEDVRVPTLGTILAAAAPFPTLESS